MLRYYYGVMNSGKSASLLMSVFQKEKDGHNCLILKPYEKRDKNMISSRVGLKRECITFTPEYNLIELIANLDEEYYPIEYIYVDECQFLTKEQVVQLWQLSTIDTNVMCFGLKTDFKNKLFESVETLMVYADKIKTIQPASGCQRCGGVATTHLLMVHGEGVLDYPTKFEGDVEGDIRFECVCQRCWHKEHGKNKVKPCN